MSGRWQRIGMTGSVALVMCGVSAWVALAAETPAATQEVPKVAPRDDKMKNPIPANEESLVAGKKLFASNCVACHGETGKGDGPLASEQSKPPTDVTKAKFARFTDGGLYWKVGDGHKPQPKFQNNLSVESRWHVVNYLRTLNVTPSTAPATQPAAKP